MSFVISVSNHKGGVGKTTIAANVGFSLARYFKILLIDIDPQCNLSSGLGITDIGENIGNYIKEIIHFRLPEVVPTKINNYVHIVPANENLTEIEDLLHETLRGEFVLKEIIAQVKGKYDLILIDCPPSLNLLTINALNCCNLVLIPAKPEKFSIDGIRLVENFAIENNLPYKIIFNQVNARLLHHQQTMSIAAGKFNGKICNNSIRNTISLAEAFGHAKDIFHYKNRSNGASDFINLADELINYI